jgi:hypothetical protein
MKDGLIVVALALTLLILTGIYREAKKHGPHALLWRWFTGNTWHGKRYTNASWTRRATTVHTDHGLAMRWHHWPRLIRAGIRTGSTLILATAIYGLIVDFRAAITALIIMGASSALIGVVIGVVGARHWHTNRTVVTPMGQAMAGILDVPESDATKAITMTPNYLSTREGEIGQIQLPPRFRATPGERESVEHLISSRLACDVDFRWNTRANPQRLSIVASPKPPTMVPFGKHVDYMESLIPGDVFMGLDRHNAPFNASFNGGDDPHWGFSVASGRGKSTTLQSIVAQILRQDRQAGGTLIDPKMSSLRPLAGIPGIILASDPSNISEMWQALYDFEKMMMARLRILNDDPTATFPIQLLVIDELNQFASMSRTHYQTIQVGEPIGVADLVRMPKTTTPPIWNWIASTLWQGRAVHCHGIFVGQRLDDRSTGGIGLRDSLGLRGLAGYRKNQWDMLIGTTPMPKSQKPRGRWIYSDGQDETWVQNVYGTESEIRDYAMTGRMLTAGPVESFPKIGA